MWARLQASMKGGRGAVELEDEVAHVVHDIRLRRRSRSQLTWEGIYRPSEERRTPFQSLLFLLWLLRLLRVRIRRDRAFKARIHLGFDAACIGAAAKGVWLEGADEGDVEVGFDLLFEAERPEDGVHKQATVAFIRDVFRRAIQRGENAAFFARGGFVAAGPLAGHRWLGGVGGGIGRHAVEWLRHGQNLAGDRFADVAAGLHPSVLHAAQDGMRGLVRHEGDAGALLVIRAVMPHPGLPEHLMAEAEFVIAALVVERILRVGRVLRNLEAVCGRAQADDGAAALQVVIEVLHLLRWEVLEAQEHHREVGRVERLDARHVRRIARDDFARVFVDAKQHSAFEALMFCQKPRQARQRLLRAILMVIRHEDDVLAFARPFGAFKYERSGGGDTG